MSLVKKSEMDMDNFSAKLAAHKGDGAHILIPQSMIYQINDLFQLRINEVSLSANILDKDVWPLPGGGEKLALSKQALYKIAQASGIEFLRSEIVGTPSRDYVVIAAAVRKRSESGVWVIYRGTYELDLITVYENLLSTLEKRIGKGQYGPKTLEEAKKKAAEETNKIRQYKFQRAETGAYLRAIRQCLALRGEYTAKELEKPFITWANHLNPDPDNPNNRQIILSIAIDETQAPPAPMPNGMGDDEWGEIYGHCVDQPDPSGASQPQAGKPPEKSASEMRAWVLKAKTGEEVEDRGAYALQKGIEIELVSQWMSEWGNDHGLTGYCATTEAMEAAMQAAKPTKPFVAANQ